MEIQLLGTGGALPPPKHAQTGIIFELDQKLLVDCGSGILLRLSDAKIDVGELNTILISHFHLDHMSELFPIITARWLSGHSHTQVLGPVGLKDLVQLHLDSNQYLKDHVTLDVVEIQPDQQFEAAGFQIEAMATVHWIPTLAFKFNKKVVFSADTEAIPEMAEFAKDCAIVIHECSFPDGMDAPFHTRPNELGELFKHTQIEKLVLTHFYPEVVGREREMVDSIKKNFAGEVVWGEDLMSLKL